MRHRNIRRWVLLLGAIILAGVAGFAFLAGL
jgi:hypothetical protein